MAKDDLGKNAIVMNIKTIKPRGLFKIFSKTTVEVTAAVDENVSPKEDIKPVSGIGDNSLAIEEKLNSLAMLLEQQMETAKDNTSKDNTFIDTKVKEELLDSNIVKKVTNSEEKYEVNNKLVDLVFEQLVNNEVSMDYARKLMDELDERCKAGTLDDLLASVYQKIILKLGETNPINLKQDKPNVVCFIGPTGVGKTTTIAKIASKYKLEDKKKVAIITADTYRIAAVEQIKTYANILTIPVEVVYEAKDLNGAIKKFEDYDLVLVDTAGRSHKNAEQFNDAAILLEGISDYDKQVYLVVSATTKYNDLSKITASYSKITDYSLIFTKLDETISYGNILNIKMDSGKNLSYVTFGQGVPENISDLNPQNIAKQLLGGSE